MSDVDTFQRMTGFHLVSGRWEKKICSFQLKRYPHSTKMSRDDRLKPSEDKNFKGQGQHLDEVKFDMSQFLPDPRHTAESNP